MKRALALIGEHYGFGRQDLFDLSSQEAVWLLECVIEKQKHEAEARG